MQRTFPCGPPLRGVNVREEKSNPVLKVQEGTIKRTLCWLTQEENRKYKRHNNNALAHTKSDAYYNNQEIEFEDTNLACLYFLRWDKETDKMWTPYRTEWKVYHSRFKLAGTVDAVFQKPDGSFLLVDWKRSKKIKKDNPWQKCFAPLGHLPDCNFSKYSLQVNVYKFILESEYSLSISQMSVVGLHPENANGSYLCFEVPILEEEVGALLKQRSGYENKNT